MPKSRNRLGQELQRLKKRKGTEYKDIWENLKKRAAENSKAAPYANPHSLSRFFYGTRRPPRPKLVQILTWGFELTNIKEINTVLEAAKYEGLSKKEIDDLPGAISTRKTLPPEARETVLPTNGHEEQLVQHIYCADMTQLIAGDAYLAGLTRGHTERMAESAFEYLATILCNDTLIYFAKPQTLNLKTPIIRAWHESSLEWQGKMSMVKPQLPAPASDRHEVMSRVFTKWVKDDRYRRTMGYTNAELLADWTRYHLGDKDLLDLYWDNNTPDEMTDALDAFRTAQGLGKRNSVALETVLSENTVLPDKISRAHWGRRPVGDFYLAWAYWNFSKGYRYILQIPNRGAYVCHWLREDTCTKGAKYETVLGERNLLKGLFPWGFVLGELLQLLGLHRSADATYGAIMELRRYTKENLRHMPMFVAPEDTMLDELRRRTAEFLQDAIARIAPPGGESVLRENRFENRLLMQAIVKQMGLEMSYSEMQAGLDLAVAASTERTGEELETSVFESFVRICRYREPARAFVARYEPAFKRFWQERGWL